jgi:hypothetical protein
MGGGYWDVGSYTSHVSAKKAAGKDIFDHDATARRTGIYTVHESLDAKKLNSVGKNVREAFDSDDHPDSLPIAVFFDVTGSMGNIPRVLQAKLPQLHGMLQRKGYVEHPQILFGGIGDAYCDRAPLQIGQFESDNRGDEQLENMILEGGGGGGNHESYELAMYYMARHADLDSLNKRGKKGYLFIIGDERVYSKVDRNLVERLIGDHLQESLTTAEVVAELQEKFEVFYIFAAEGSYTPEHTIFDGGRNYSGDGVCYWRDLLGQNAIILEDANLVCETIALTLGLSEGIVDLSAGLTDLAEFGVNDRDREVVGATLAKTDAAAKGSIATAVDGSLPDSGGEGATRL